MDTHEAREVAANFLGNILFSAFENTTVEEIEGAFEVDFADAMSIMFEMGSATVEIGWSTENCSCDDDELEDIAVGDPDPNADLPDDYDCCSERSGAWHCTRLAGHSGNHVAGDGDEVCAVWS